MNKIYSLSFLSILFSILFATSCKKVENKAVLQSNPSMPKLAINSLNIVVDSSSANINNTALSISSSSADYGFNAAVAYTLQLVLDSTSWTDASVKNITLDETMKKEYTNQELNTLAISMGIEPYEIGIIKARVKAQLINNVKNDPIYSDEVKISVTPFEAIAPELPKIYVPGDYQGWAPDQAQYIESQLSDGVFNGIIEKTKADGTLSNGEFKFSAQPSWTGTNYGAGAGANDLSTDAGAGNLNLPDGTYKFMVNTNTMMWSWEEVNWGIIGTSTPDGWTSDQNMRYNPDTKLYEITIDLIAGQIKFRLNNDWGTNIGWGAGFAEGDPVPVDGSEIIGAGNGPNFGIAEDGNYTIKINPDTKAVYITKN